MPNPTNPFGIPTDYPLPPEAYGRGGPPAGYTTYIGPTGGGGIEPPDLPAADYYPDLSGEPVVIVNGGPNMPIPTAPSDPNWIYPVQTIYPQGNYSGYQPPAPRAVANTPGFYPSPGPGGQPARDWRINARSVADQRFRNAANAIATAMGYGTGTAEHPGVGGEWAQIANIPSFSGFLPVGNWGGGNQRYLA